MPEIKNIVKQLKNNMLSRDIDEKNAGGFYDLAIIAIDDLDLPSSEYYALLDDLYSLFYEIYDETITNQ